LTLKINKNLKYEDCYDIVIGEISKRRPKWYLTSLSWMDFDDVIQIISFHIYVKWEKYDNSQPLKPWLNKIISNQLKNILRNNYSNFVRPCLSCPFNLSGDGVEESSCSFTKSGSQDSSCPLFKKWEKTKKAAYDIKLPLSIDSDAADHKEIPSVSCEIVEAEQRLHKEMKKALPDRQFMIYKMLFMDYLSEEDVAKKMGYKTSETGRKAGYKQIKNLKKQFKEKAKKLILSKDIFLR
jgi:RNA polymerase sigma factor (sigma-70 family)